MNQYKKMITSSMGISILILCSKVIGFIKQSICARTFGATALTDTYYLSESFVVSMATCLFAATNVTFMTTYISEKEKSNRAGIRTMVNNMYLAFGIIAVVIICILFIFSGGLAAVIGVNYNKQEQGMIASYIQKLSVIFLFQAVINISGAVLNGEKKFFYEKFLGIFNSISIIGMVLLLHKIINVEAILLGMVAGNGIFSVFLYSRVRKLWGGSWQNPFQDIRVKKIIRQSIPLMIGNAIITLNAVIDKIIASVTGDGEVSILQYSQIISHDIISAVIVASVSTVFFSYAAEKVIQHKEEDLKLLIRKVITILLIILVGIYIIYSITGDMIIKIIYGKNTFSEAEVQTIERIIQCYAVGFIPLAIREIFVKCNYAYDNVKSATINGMAGVVVNISLSIFFVGVIGSAGVALATSISYLVVAAMGYFSVKKYLEMKVRDLLDIPVIMKILSAAVLSSVLLSSLDNFKAETHIAFWLMECVVTITVYVLLLYLLRCREVRQMVGIIRERIK